MTARSCRAENGSAASFRSDRHKTHCSDRRWSAPFDCPRADARNKIRVALRSTCKTADTTGTRYVHPAASSTNARDNQTASVLRPLLPISLRKSDLARHTQDSKRRNRRRRRKQSADGGPTRRLPPPKRRNGRCEENKGRGEPSSLA